MAELKLEKFVSKENLPEVTKITIAKSTCGKWFLCFSLGNVFTYNYPLKISEKARHTIADLLNAEMIETNVKFVRVIHQHYDRFYLYEKEGKVICVLLAIDGDAFCHNGYQFTFEISRPELIPEISMEHSCIVFNEDFK